MFLLYHSFYQMQNRGKNELSLLKHRLDLSGYCVFKILFGQSLLSEFVNFGLQTIGIRFIVPLMLNLSNFEIILHNPKNN